MAGHGIQGQSGGPRERTLQLSRLSGWRQPHSGYHSGFIRGGHQLHSTPRCNQREMLVPGYCLGRVALQETTCNPGNRFFRRSGGAGALDFIAGPRLTPQFALQRRDGSVMQMKVAFSLLPLAALALTPFAVAQTTYTYISVDYPGAAYTVLNGVNSSGTIVGAYSWTVAGYPLYSFLRSPEGSFTPLLVGTLSNATGISDSGVIVGSAGSTASNRRVGFILSNRLNLIDSSVYSSSLNGISTNSSVVGAFEGLGGAHGFVTVGGKLSQLP